jgi:hypothetical protein
MAKSIKKTVAKAEKKKPVARPKIKKSFLVALPKGIAVSATVNVVFKSGIGQVTAVLFRNGVLINMQSISTDGNIQFSQVQSHDSISINGVCSGDAVITISVPTNPGTPDTFSKEIIVAGYIIL